MTFTIKTRKIRNRHLPTVLRTIFNRDYIKRVGGKPEKVYPTALNPSTIQPPPLSRNKKQNNLTSQHTSSNVTEPPSRLVHTPTDYNSRWTGSITQMFDQRQKLGRGICGSLRFVCVHLLGWRLLCSSLTGCAFAIWLLLLRCLRLRSLGGFCRRRSLWLRSWLRFRHNRLAEPVDQGLGIRPLSNKVTQKGRRAYRPYANLSSVSAFFLRSAARRTGFACFGRASCCCFFSISQVSASEHSLMTCKTEWN